MRGSERLEKKEHEGCTERGPIHSALSQKEATMEPVLRTLIHRLLRKGVEISTIPAYIRDVANAIIVNCPSDLEDLNRRLHVLGWNDVTLDDYTLELIMAIFEPDFTYKPPSYFDEIFNPEHHHMYADQKEHPHDSAPL
jgi:hypothetical protein